MSNDGTAREEVSKLPSMRSPEAFGRARAWLEKCLTSRTPCGGQWTPSHSKIPTRLLYVQDAHTCRLTEASELPADLRYLTLSHCWGSSATKTLCLTTQNMAALKTAVPLQHLSRVFQDALAVTRELGYHYLWIDSLCIVQDSLDDWRSESLRMGDVYKNSTCNLSSLGPDGSHGLLKSSRADEIPTLETLVEYRIRSGAGVMVPFLTGARYYGLIFDRAGRGTWRDVEEAPLNRRAWVLQERVLSPRILHFGHAQMFWECDHLCANELFPCGFDTTLYPFLAAAERATVFNRDLRSRVAVAPEWSAHVLGSFWDEVISAHSASSLTFPTDKLVSLAGLGREIESLFRKRYLSGMFPLDFPCSLLWTVAQPSGRHGLVLPVTIDRRPEQGAPSWSWASLDGAVLAWGSYQYNKRVVCCSRWTMVCTVSIADPLPTPQLDLDLGHRLAVRGSLRRFTPGDIVHAQELATFCWTAPHRWTLKLFPDTGTFPLHSREPGPLWERHFAPFILSFFFLPFLQGKDRIDDLTELNFAAGDLLGLGLLPVDDAVGTYRRIGLVRLRSLAAEKNSTLEMPWTEFTTDDPIPQEPGGNGVYLTLV